MVDTTPASGVSALLAIWVRVPSEVKADYDRWHDEEHLPERRRVPGFRNATRFVPIDGSENHMALYELDSAEVLETEPYLALKRKVDTELGLRVRAGWRDHERIIYRHRFSMSKDGSHPVDAPYIQTVRASYRDGSEDQVREWLDQEHAGRQLEVDGVLSYQGFEPVSGQVHFLNLWGLVDPSAVTSDAWEVARQSPWRDRLQPARGESIRHVFRRWDESEADRQVVVAR